MPNKEEPELTPKQRETQCNEGMRKLTQTSMILIESAKALIEGVPFSKEAFCKKTGFSMEEVEQSIQDLLDQQEKVEHLEYSYEVPLTDKELELSGWPLPPDEIKLLFDAELEESEVFEVFGDSKTEDQFKRVTKGSLTKKINIYGHITFVEDMFYDHFDEDISCILMNSFFWIFYHKGYQWLPIRSYAIEMLKLFPQAILKQYHQSEHFIVAFSNFTKDILAPGGICCLQRRPTPWEVKNGLYTIKATDAFHYLLEPS